MGVWRFSEAWSTLVLFWNQILCGSRYAACVFCAHAGCYICRVLSRVLGQRSLWPEIVTSARPKRQAGAPKVPLSELQSPTTLLTAEWSLYSEDRHNTL